MADTNGSNRPRGSAQTPREVARHARLRDAVVYAAIHAGDLVAVQIRGRFKVFPQDRDEWLAKHRTR